MAKGRPMLMDAVRYACGQINRAETKREQEAKAKKAGEIENAPPSPKVKSARDLFNAKCFKNGGQGHNAGDPIGQLWLLRKLEMPDMDDARLLMTARDWWHSRSVVFKGLEHKTAKYERASRTSNSSTKATKAERDYYRYSSFLLDADDYDVSCLESLMETTLDGDAPCWVSRIIQTELLRYVRLPVAELAGDDDRAKFAGAMRALRALAGASALRKSAA